MANKTKDKPSLPKQILSRDLLFNLINLHKCKHKDKIFHDIKKKWQLKNNQLLKEHGNLKNSKYYLKKYINQD